MGCWSPVDAMKAYMHTLELCKDYNINHECNTTRTSSSSSKLMEPKCMEFISAIAAGNQSHLILDVASDVGISTSTLPLAVAATHSGGRLVCIRTQQHHLQEIKSNLEPYHHELKDLTIEFKLGDPCQVVKQYRKIDFTVIDYRVKDCAEILFAMDLNPSGSVVVVSNLFQEGRRVGRRSSSGTPFGQLMVRGGCRSVIMPIGDGMEITRIEKGRIGKKGVRKSSKRTFMVYEEWPKLHGEARAMKLASFLHD